MDDIIKEILNQKYVYIVMAWEGAVCYKAFESLKSAEEYGFSLFPPQYKNFWKKDFESWAWYNKELKNGFRVEQVELKK